MAKKMLIDATHAEETRVVVVDGNKVEEFDFESLNKRQLAGNIYLAKVTRVEPSLQAAFVDYGGNRHGFLAFSEIHPDYYQIPVADRQALLAEERAYAASLDRDEGDEPAPKKRRSRGQSKAEASKPADAVTRSGPEQDAEAATPGEEAEEQAKDAIPGMDVVELDPGSDAGPAMAEDLPEGDGAELQPDAEGELPDAASRDTDIESIADEDVTEEIRQPRKPRARKYKIQEVIKVRQILLVQVVKEERGNKGAALTTYLSLAGRYCVLMPNTARGGGISRKITNVTDRKKLKQIASDIDVPEGAGLIIRTAGAQRTKSEIKRDYEYLLRLWEQIRELTLKSIAPAPIYEEGNLIKRSIRDLYNREIDEVFVEGEHGYRIAKDFMKMLMPSHAKNVKHYADPMPLFARYQVESYLAAMFNPTVQLKSGGYIVIGVTEALVAIDVNSGRATKEGSIEETALKTNLEAAEEVARQLRLRDLAGLIVIDFIDMDERKNNAAVEKRFKDKLKTDRARIQVGRISGFGLMEMSRQRLRPGMIEATTQPCPACHGTGLIRSDDSLALSILRQLEEEGVRSRSKEVLVKAPVAIANFIMNQKREHVGMIEARYSLSIRVEADPFLVSPDFSIERFKTATRAVPEAMAPVISVDMSNLPEIEEGPEPQDSAAPASEAPDEEDGQPKKRRRRRRRSRGGRNKDENGENGTAEAGSAETPPAQGVAADSDDASDGAGEGSTGGAAAEASATSAELKGDADAGEKPAKKKVVRSRKRKSDETPDAGDAAEAAPEEDRKPAKSRSRKSAKAEPEAAADTAAKTSNEPVEDAEAQDGDAAEKADTKPKKAPRKRAPRRKKSEEKPEATDTAAAAEAAEPVLADAADSPGSDGIAEEIAAGAPIAPEPATAADQPPEREGEAASAPLKELVDAEAATDGSAAPLAEPDDAAEEGDEPSRPKRRGWWSLGR